VRPPSLLVATGADADLQLSALMEIHGKGGARAAHAAEGPLEGSALVQGGMVWPLRAGLICRVLASAALP
jgi:hypothetical protein